MNYPIWDETELPQQTVEIGQKVKFDPFKGIRDGRGLYIRPIMETGTVVEVYDDHSWFSVEYVDNENRKQRASFKFDDIGYAVEIIE